ncbi:uncharacterized protein FIESC28_02214 [Fusarium coffeatum]|uniref:Uncharacterized protein n=1 Tax=Fusarium coffeatum TaxID=231269 RepID=A0A366S6J7_9HYPO|nr:uncharacterized protein FIESC28_02214 [Fusarium coffeatum]RBR24944.1 hypothetical protein FIESC28_02214 [Fusarium coffeatum]
MPEMTPSSFSQISNFVYNQQPLLPETSQSVQKLESTKEEGPSSSSWEEYIKADGPARDRTPSNQLLTRGLEAQNEQLQLNQERLSPSYTIKADHEHIPQSQSSVTPGNNPKNNAASAPDTIDPRLFGANYDARTFAKKSP